MIKFKQKEYTIQEGHYTGPKDLDKVPGSLEVIGKATIGGTAAGGVIGGVLKEAGVEGTAVTEGMAGLEDYYKMDGGIITVNTEIHLTRCQMITGHCHDMIDQFFHTLIMRC